MISNVFKNSDPINKLPTDDDELSLKEKSIIEMLYPLSSQTLDTLNTSNASNTSDILDTSNTSNLSNLSNVSNDAIKKLPEDTQKAWFHFKDVIIASILFFILNLPISDRLLQNVIKTENLHYRILAKSLTFAMLFFFINNFGLARKN